ncbi:TetR/AcrR family transcriptional regulator [Paraoerskovia marina]|uniref:TetR/AcrR family transcriptional regulator n=1 Tax=Paraoerskovia marina TaxID=545619 RepID=UPI00200A1C25|nr:helix-turn-helix domain-containing protein [Paraoerskovia marina]
MTPTTGPAPQRMTRVARRAQVLRAARSAFARGGYAGTSTEQVARAAGVSQPYVVRMFGGKRELFRAVFDDVCDEVIATFESVPLAPGSGSALGDAYLGLLVHRDLPRVLMHGLIAGDDPEIGARARAVIARAFEISQRHWEGSAERAQAFVAEGLLINVFLAVDAPEHRDEPGMADLVARVLDSSILLTDPHHPEDPR